MKKLFLVLILALAPIGFAQSGGFGAYVLGGTSSLSSLGIGVAYKLGSLRFGAELPLVAGGAFGITGSVDYLATINQINELTSYYLGGGARLTFLTGGGVSVFALSPQFNGGVEYKLSESLTLFGEGNFGILGFVSGSISGSGGASGFLPVPFTTFRFGAYFR